MDTDTPLEERIAELRAGIGDPRAMVGELRRAVVLVPLEGGGLWTAESGGVRWILGFSDEEALARFARARDTGDGRDTGRSWEFAALLGARLLDEIVPAIGVPAGVAMNVADPDGSMLFPPVMGIVPDAVAVDADGTHGGQG
ncbi:hypothetical protein ACWGI0_32620 [Streptomyces sp. NPDC054802]